MATDGSDNFDKNVRMRRYINKIRKKINSATRRKGQNLRKKDKEENRALTSYFVEHDIRVYKL